MDTVKVLYYEVGHDETNILGSGSIRTASWQGKSEDEAFKQFNQPYVNYLIRYVRKNGKLCSEWYNIYTKEWE